MLSLEDSVLRVLVSLVPGFILGGMVHALSGENDTLALLVAGPCLLIADLVLRWTRRSHRPWPISSKAGGSVLAFPIWLLGMAQIVVATLRVAGVLKSG